MTWELTEHITSSNPHLSWLTKLEEMMEKKRTRAWRRHQARRVFKARLKYVGACQLGPRKLWHEIMNDKGVQCYRTTGTPCSCWLCKNEPFNRMAVKKEGKAIIKENLEWRWQIFLDCQKLSKPHRSFALIKPFGHGSIQIIPKFPWRERMWESFWGSFRKPASWICTRRRLMEDYRRRRVLPW